MRGWGHGSLLGQALSCLPLLLLTGGAVSPSQIGRFRPLPALLPKEPHTALFTERPWKPASDERCGRPLREVSRR